jgi:MtN3 and saliva related transmembrane protein
MWLKKCKSLNIGPLTIGRGERIYESHQAIGCAQQLRDSTPAREDEKMSAVALLGLGAGFCTTVAFVPQVIKTWRTRHTEDISLGMFLIYLLGNLLWLLYGLVLGDLPLIAANAATFVLAGSVLYFKLRYG